MVYAPAGDPPPTHKQQGQSQGGVYLSDHLASGLGSFSVSGSFPFEGEDSFSGGAILQSELTDDPTETGDFNVSDRGGRLTQEQQEGVEPAGGEVVIFVMFAEVITMKRLIQFLLCESHSNNV